MGNEKLFTKTIYVITFPIKTVLKDCKPIIYNPLNISLFECPDKVQDEISEIMDKVEKLLKKVEDKNIHDFIHSAITHSISKIQILDTDFKTAFELYLKLIGK